jgi:hypothetical protein
MILLVGIYGVGMVKIQKFKKKKKNFFLIDRIINDFFFFFFEK